MQIIQRKFRDDLKDFTNKKLGKLTIYSGMAAFAGKTAEVWKSTERGNWLHTCGFSFPEEAFEPLVPEAALEGVLKVDVEAGTIEPGLGKDGCRGSAGRVAVSAVDRKAMEIFLVGGEVEGPK